MKSNIYLLALSVMAFLPIFIPLYCKTGPSQAKHVSRCAVSLHAKRLLVFFMLSKDQCFFGLKPISQIFSLILETRNAEGQRLEIFLQVICTSSHLEFTINSFKPNYNIQTLEKKKLVQSIHPNKYYRQIKLTNNPFLKILNGEEYGKISFCHRSLAVYKQLLCK